MKQYSIESSYMRTPVSYEVDETFTAYHHGIKWTITVLSTNKHGVVYMEEGTVPFRFSTKVKKYKRFVSAQHFITKWWNHRIPA